MTAERWQEIRLLFDRCLETPSTERAACLAAYAHDPDLVEEVRKLLENHEAAADGFLTPPDAVIRCLRRPSLLTTGALINDRFRIVRFIGQGGMAEVYEAYDTELREPIAIKAIRLGGAEDSPEVAHCLRELQISRRVSHPNVCRVFDFLRYQALDGVHILITMELVPGVTLAQRLEEGPIPPDLANRIAIQLLSGLEAAHAAGVIHRDLKPSNIMLAGERVVVMDFGVARGEWLAPQGTSLAVTGIFGTSSQAWVGTLDYMAPEQLSGNPATRRSDLYALGLVLHEVLCGQKPFASQGGSLPNLLQRLQADVPRSSLPPGALGTAVAHCLKRDPAERPESASEILQQLEQDARRNAPRSKRLARIGAAFVIAVVIGLLVAVLTRMFPGAAPTRVEPSTEPGRIVPFTAMRGAEDHPAFSPDGERIAFTWNEDKGPVGHVYVQDLHGGRLQQITFDADSDTHPVWSPDGRWIAFVRRPGGSDGNLMLVPSKGGPVRRLMYLPIAHGGINWSHHGQFLAYSYVAFEGVPGQIHVFNLENGQDIPLTAPPAGSYGDFDPVFSPDDRAIAFVRFRSQDENEAEIDLLPLEEVTRPGGQPLTVLRGTDYIQGLTWSPGGRDLIFSSFRGGPNLSLWRLRDPRHLGLRSPVEQITFGASEASWPNESPRGGLLAYHMDTTTPTQITRRALSPGKSVEVSACPSSSFDTTPQLSRDGRRMYFISLRSGNYEIWECAIDTGNTKKLTSFDGPHVGALRLSPDQKELVFDGVSQGRWIVYRMSLLPGATPRPLICHTSNSVRPSWSHDGRFVYFSSDRTGDWEIWRAPVSGGQQIQMTHHGGLESFETRDGKTLFFDKRNRSGLWSRSLLGGDDSERRVSEIGADGRWSLGRDAMYLLTDAREQRWSFELLRLQLATGKLSRVLKLDQRTCLPFEPSISVSYDERFLAYASRETPQSDIMMIISPEASQSRQ